MNDNFKEFQIVVSSSTPDTGFKASKSLRNWLQAEDFESGFEVKQERKPLQEDDAGGELLAALGINIGSNLMADFGRSFYSWFKTRSVREKTLSITIKTAQGHEIAISAQSIGNGEQEFIQNLVKLMNDGSQPATPPPPQSINENSAPNWTPMMSQEQWRTNHQTIQHAIMEGETKKALNLFEELLYKEGLNEHLNIVKIRKAEWERTDRDFKYGTIGQEYFDQKMNLVNKVVLDLLVEMDHQIKQLNN